MADGVELAVSLFLPHGEPQPCLLEALPYRKDDLTSSYAESYRALRDTYGYAVARVDLRGTGSSGGDATDEYPLVERSDLGAVIAWLAEQEWCDGNVGMFGTSYSGFNALQIAAERPPALKAVCAIYSSDDRWTDDVHWRGHALRLVDLVDYCHYMTPMCVLPPVPAEWPSDRPGDWREEWRRRLATNEPWVLTWLRENRDGPYWRAGSVRHAPYSRIEAATMIVAGWADGYRNNSFRTVAALGEAGTPWRLLAGPWAHADPATAIPGPRIDLDVEMAAWFDRWLRDRGPEHVDRADLFVRTSTVPEPDLDLHLGEWVSGPWPVASRSWELRGLPGPRSLAVEPDVGTTAWIDCAGHLPWGLSGDQREDDARSLTWDSTPPVAAVVGQPRARLRVSASAPAASLSVKLCDVFPDGTSALVSRGTLDLAYRSGSTPEPLVPGEVYEVDLQLDACAYRWTPGQTLRVSVAGSDWPNTVAPPAPVTLTVHDGSLELPLWPESAGEPPVFTPGEPSSSEDPEGVVWSVTRDVLRRTTTCAVRSGATYDIPRGGTASEEYVGEVGVDRRTFAQWADATTTFTLSWDDVDVRVTSTMRVDVGATAYDVVIGCDAFEGDELVSHREWRETIPRRPGDGP
ncbi:CocE/NonD family hydrolase [Nocardioides sp.]|uniref:CocE/NonD family hydrolase n=1 Tax=Nocardioides sp. TaxID=35761 RepID=UPI001A1F41CD|nr:CocE/NonD family hydrolase [Nocardioides sp.]MBJ7356402.1 CocE/NonD family hydrolase [Nocardioides sp.]